MRIVPGAINTALKQGRAEVDVKSNLMNLRKKILEVQNQMSGPQPVAPTMQTMGRSDALNMGIGGALATLLGARPEYVQAGMGAYQGGIQDRNQNVYQGQMADYKTKLEAQGQALRGAQFGLNLAQDDYARSENKRNQIEDRRLKASDQRRAERVFNERDTRETKSNIFQSLANRVKDSASAQSAIASMVGTPYDTPEMRAAIEQQGRDGDVAKAEEARMKWARVPIKDLADAKRYIASRKLKPGDPEHDAILEVGMKKEEFYRDYHMTNEEKKDYWQYQQKVLQAGREDLLYDRQAFDEWKFNKSQAGMNQRFYDGQNAQNQRLEYSQSAQNNRTEYTQGAISSRNKNKPGPMPGPIPDAGGFAPMAPMLPPGMQSGVPNPSVRKIQPIRRDNVPDTRNLGPVGQSKPTVKVTQKKKEPEKKPQTKVKVIKKGNKTTFDFGGK